MRQRRLYIRRLIIVSAWMLVLPACLPVTGPGAGSTVCDSNGDCVSDIASTCNYYGDPSACERVGCVWEPYCAGIATPCGYLVDATCVQQYGCYWDENMGICAGSEDPCEAFVGSACAYQIGCESIYGCLDG